MDQWMGNVFYRGASPSEIKAMAFHELRYWNEWHEVFLHREESV
jgi:hypothetical protein